MSLTRKMAICYFRVVAPSIPDKHFEHPADLMRPTNWATKIRITKTAKRESKFHEDTGEC